MWKAVRSVQFPMDAREAYQAIVSAGDAGPVVDLSANGVRFTCRPRPGLVQPGQYCVLLEASLIVQTSPAVFYGLAKLSKTANSGRVQSVHSDLVVARLLIRQSRPGSSEGILEIVPYLELPDTCARCLANLAIQHTSGSAFHELCEPLMRGLVADGGIGLAIAAGWLPSGDLAAPLEPAGLGQPEDAVPLDVAEPRVLPAPCVGRPRLREDDWAREQVHLLGRGRKEVYTEWLHLMPAERRERLKDTWESFKYVLRPPCKKRRRARGAGGDVAAGPAARENGWGEERE